MVLHSVIDIGSLEKCHSNDFNALIQHFSKIRGVHMNLKLPIVNYSSNIDHVTESTCSFHCDLLNTDEARNLLSCDECTVR